MSDQIARFQGLEASHIGHQPHPYERQKQTKHLRSWEGPSANGSDGGSKKCGWDVVGGRGRSGRGEQNEEEARRSVGVNACGEVEVWMDAGGGRKAGAGVVVWEEGA